jgi:hypothetical protein
LGDEFLHEVGLRAGVHQRVVHGGSQPAFEVAVTAGGVGVREEEVTQ